MVSSSTHKNFRATPFQTNQKSVALSGEEFARLMKHLEGLPSLALAVSGGIDSLSLLLLAAQWQRRQIRRQENSPRIHVLSVNHGMRPQAVQEAHMVAQIAQMHGLTATILQNRESVPLRNKQAVLRNRRYDLLCGWCRAQGVSSLLLGHQLEDQAETFLLRLARGSGIDGLAAMWQDRIHQGVHLYRPLLNISRARLRTVVEQSGIAWIEDPSNHDPAYARSRLRKLSEPLAREGIDTHRLVRTAAHMGRARRALEEITRTSLRQHARLMEAGYVVCEKNLLQDPDEIALRALSRLLMAVGGRLYAPRLSQLERALSALRYNLHQNPRYIGRRGHRTLSGCKFFLHRSRESVDERFFIIREPAATARAAPLRLNSTPFPYRQGEMANMGVWDGRFQVFAARSADSLLEIRALGKEGLRQWKSWAKTSTPSYPAPYPADICYSLPALWREEKLLCVPHLNFLSSSIPFRIVLVRPQGLQHNTKM